MVVEIPVEEVAVSSLESTRSLFGFIVSLILILTVIIFLFMWIWKLLKTEAPPAGIGAFYYPSIAKISTLLVLGGVAFFGLMSCFITDTTLPAMCYAGRILALPPMIIVDPIGDMIGMYDGLIILLAIIVVVLFYYTLVCGFFWVGKKIRT